ncbi:hypothetical protein D3C80_1207990 [compost metagenome]
MVRLRFQGKGMKIAGDTFVHHYGSMTMRELGSSGYIEVNTRNQQFFEEKWGSPYELLQRVQPLLNTGSLRNIDFYPSHTWISDSGGRLYWLEHGMKHTVAGNQIRDQINNHTTRLSVMDMLQIPTGPELPTLEMKKTSAGISHGGVIRDSRGILYQIDRGKRREMLSSYTCEAWGLHIKEVLANERSELMQLPLGLPILPPPRLLSDDL